MRGGSSEPVEGVLTVTDNFVIPSAELDWRFSRSSGPGGQGVNTSDSRVELTWSLRDSESAAGLSEVMRTRLQSRLGPALVDGALTVAASEHRAQLRNREAARLRLAQLLREALATPSRRRRPTRPTRGSIERRLQAKQRHARTKQDRRRPDAR